MLNDRHSKEFRWLVQETFHSSDPTNLPDSETRNVNQPFVHIQGTLSAVPGFGSSAFVN